MKHEKELLSIRNARTHNLKNIDLDIPRDQLVVLTGLSGSGKSSLAFDTIYAEGQRRYLETFSAYARQFLGGLERPDVDKIDGLSPVIAIEQKTTSRSPRSTVGTITEIYDFLRLLYARVATGHSPVTDLPMVRYTLDQIVELIVERFENQSVSILAPLVRSRKGHYRELFEGLLKQGFLRARIDGVIIELTSGMKLDRYKTHDIELVVDRFPIQSNQLDLARIKQSVSLGLKKGSDVVLVHIKETNEVHYFSASLMCPESGISLDAPEPNSFSFNSPKGMCSRCKGLGVVSRLSMREVLPDPKLSIRKGGIAPLGTFKKNWIFGQIEQIGLLYDFNLDTKIEDLSDKAVDALINGVKETINIPSKSLGVTRNYQVDYEGIGSFIQGQYDSANSTSIRRWASQYLEEQKCGECDGSRLNKEATYFKIAGRTLADLAALDLAELFDFFETIEKHLGQREQVIAEDLLKEIRSRIRFMLNVGLDYLALNRGSKSLSGGEAQRIRLATQIGSQLVGVLYILDEPSIGLHQRDNMKLIQALSELRDLGNSVLVVEHDKDMILESDQIIDVGPAAGKYGGEITFQGSPDELRNANTLTASYISGEREVPLPEKRRVPKDFIQLKGCTGHNLKNISIDIPLGVLTVVSGVSGSGKSSLINQTLYPIMNAFYFNGVKEPLPYKKITGLELCDKVIDVNQSPIGRTPRSNPATYTGVFNEIRSLFTKTTEAVIRGYKPGRFSFNVKGGRCETCQGAGLKVIEMNFLPDVHVPCETCYGKRFNRETLEVRYRGKSISDVLEMTIEEATEFFEAIPKIHRILKTLNDVGLGYIALGQASTTLSGGEAQRVKLATELAKRDTGKTFYILDEPTTGLHFEDVRILMEVLQRLVNKGNSVLIIEHNLEVIKIADYIIDIGPEGGKGGGQIVATGTPEQVARSKKSLTAPFLKQELK
ncbi:MAG: excinuclease ABC subunit UvrA [Bacteroidetes bacterium]|nr:MAG: excinuclease ABC subunit UvrA [Bacteroidota bacterium]